MKAFLGAMSLALTMTVASCEPAHAVDSACVGPDQVLASDQEKLDQTEGFKGYTARELGRSTGENAKGVGAILAQLGAPAEVSGADTFIFLTADAPEGEQPVAGVHVVALKDGCKTGGGFIPKEIVKQMLGEPA